MYAEEVSPVLLLDESPRAVQEDQFHSFRQPTSSYKRQICFLLLLLSRLLARRKQQAQHEDCGYDFYCLCCGSRREH